MAGRPIPPRAVEPIPLAGYKPNNHRPAAPHDRANPDARLPLDLGEHLEWVTVVYSGRLGKFLGLNDTEFACLSNEESGDWRVLGQSIRPVSPDSGLLRSSDTLLGLFGIENEVVAHMPAQATSQATATA